MWVVFLLLQLVCILCADVSVFETNFDDRVEKIIDHNRPTFNSRHLPVHCQQNVLPVSGVERAPLSLPGSAAEGVEITFTCSGRPIVTNSMRRRAVG